jgi:hypothetical protein
MKLSRHLRRIVMAALIDPVAQLSGRMKSHWGIAVCESVFDTFGTSPAGQQVLHSAFNAAVEKIA